jgi:hypothetical protein
LCEVLLNLRGAYPLRTEHYEPFGMHAHTHQSNKLQCLQKDAVVSSDTAKQHTILNILISLHPTLLAYALRKGTHMAIRATIAQQKGDNVATVIHEVCTTIVKYH